MQLYVPLFYFFFFFTYDDKNQRKKELQSVRDGRGLK